jgi:hypothetical protein
MTSFGEYQSLGFYASPNVSICNLAATGSEALAVLRANWHGVPSDPLYVVVLDCNNVPKGLFRAECTLDWQPGTADACLADLALLPLPAIAEHTSITEFLQRISQYEHFAEVWALVDRRGKYSGVLEVLPMLRQMLCPTLNPKLSSANSLEDRLLNQDRAIAQLVALIEQLPSPIVVYGRSGEVLGMN